VIAMPNLFDDDPTHTPTIHDFEESLKESRAQADGPWWETCYRAAFGASFGGMVNVRDNCAMQRAGVDRIITLTNGRVIKIDEKVRKKAWPDILLERWSDTELKKPGWIQKPLECEFIAYAFVSIQTCYLLPALTLQRAWRLHGREWIACYGAKLALNRGYATESVPVPTEVLLRALGDAMTVRWSAP
jgi:hypothetical protein